MGERPGYGDMRQPPQDLDAEQSVLGAMLLSKDAIADVLEQLRPGDFYRPANQKIFDTIIDLYAQGEPADPVTVAAELDRLGALTRIGGAPYLHTLISVVPTAANASYYASIVAEKAQLRRLVEAGTRIVQYGYAGADGAEVADVVSRAQAEIFDVTTDQRSEDVVALEELLGPALEELETIQNDGGMSRGVPTGFVELDEVIHGLHGGQMVIVAARPGVGKALSIDTELPTPHGWTTMADVAIGDHLIGADGNPTHVVAATEIMHERPCYSVEFDDGSALIADALHQWPTLAGTRTTVELRPGSDAIAATAPVCDQLVESPPAAAYVAGAWLADRPATRQLHLSVAALSPFLRSSSRQRRALLLSLAGAQAHGDNAWITVRDNTRRPGLLDFAQELAAAEGLISRRTDRGICIAMPGRGPRHRTITAVRPIPPVPVRCVEVDNHDHTYLAGRTMIPTHNSTLGLDFMRSCSIKHGFASVIFSLEMSKSEIVMRLLSAETSIRLADMRAGKMHDNDWATLARRMGQLSEAPLFIDDSPNLSMPEIRAKSRRLAQQHDLRLIVVDYLQLMSSGQRVESRQQEVSDLSRNIKLLAKDLDVPIVAISQLNRGPEQRQDKRPNIADLRESGSLEQDCDIALLLHRPDSFDRDDPRAGEADIIIGKHRGGPTKTITVCHQLHVSRFANMAREMREL